MKKHNILKVTGLSFLVLTLLTWIIPAGTYSGPEFVKGEVSPTGLFDLFYNPLMMIGVVFQYAIILLVIGGFYGVISKSGVYTKIVNSVVKKFNKKEKRFLIISTIVFALLASIVGYPFILFVLVPFAAAVITLLGFNKITAMLSTVGAMMVGVVGSTTSADIAGTLATTYTTDITDNLLIKFAILVVVTTLYTISVVKMSKVEVKEVKETKEEPKKTTKKVAKKETTKTTKKTTTKAEAKGKKDVVKVKKEIKKEVKKVEKNVLLYNEKDIKKDKNALPLIIIFGLLLVLIIISTFNWSLFKITFFDDIYKNIMEVKLFDKAIIEFVLGYVSPFGYWSIYEFVAVLLILIPLISWIYSVKVDDVVDGFIAGAKTMIKPAVAVVLASLMFSVFISVTQGGLSLAQNNIYFTIMNFLFGITDGFNSIVAGIVTFIGGFMISDFSILNSFISMPSLSLYDPESFKILTLVIQTVYGLTLFIAPSSMLLLAGLSLFDISYKDWFKMIGKLLIKVALLVIIVLVVTLFI